MVGFANKATSLSRRVAMGLGAAAGGLLAGGIGAVRIAAEFEQVEIGFTQMMGSAARAKDFLADLWDFAARTPFNFGELASAGQRLMAFGFQAESIIPIMQVIGDQAAALGAQGPEAIGRIIRALGQMRTRGRVMTQELNQLTEVGIAAWEMLAEHIGVSTQEIQKMVEGGQIDAATGIQAILQGMASRTGGMMQAQSRTILGMLSTLRDQATGILTLFGQDIVEKTGLGGLLENMTGFVGGFLELAQRVGALEALKQIVPPEAAQAATALAGAITAALIPALVGLGVAAVSALAPIAPLLIAGAVAALAWANNWGGVRDKAAAAWEFIGQLIARVVSAVGPQMVRLAEVVGSHLQLIGQFFSLLGQFVGAVFAGDWARAMQLGAQIIETLKQMVGHTLEELKIVGLSLLLSFVEGVVGLMNSLGMDVATIWQNIANTVLDAINKLIGAVDGALQRLNNITLPTFRNPLDALLGRASGFTRPFNFEPLSELPSVEIGAPNFFSTWIEGVREDLRRRQGEWKAMGSGWGQLFGGGLLDGLIGFFTQFGGASLKLPAVPEFTAEMLGLDPNAMFTTGGDSAAAKAAEKGIKDFADKLIRAWEDVIGDIRGAVEQALQLSGTRRPEDFLMEAAGLRKIQPDEWVARLMDVVNRGGESPWATALPELLGLDGDALRGAAANLIDQIQNFLRPDLIPFDALLARAREILIGQRNRGALIDRATAALVAEGFGLDEIKKALEDQLGVSVDDASEKGNLVESVLAKNKAALEQRQLDLKNIGAEITGIILSGASEAATEFDLIQQIIMAVLAELQAAAEE